MSPSPIHISSGLITAQDAPNLPGVVSFFLRIRSVRNVYNIINSIGTKRLAEMETRTICVFRIPSVRYTAVRSTAMFTIPNHYVGVRYVFRLSLTRSRRPIHRVRPYTSMCIQRLICFRCFEFRYWLLHYIMLSINIYTYRFRYT